MLCLKPELMLIKHFRATAVKGWVSILGVLLGDIIGLLFGIMLVAHREHHDIIEAVYYCINALVYF